MCVCKKTADISVTAEQEEQDGQDKQGTAGGLDAESAHLLSVLAGNIRLFRGQRGMTRKNLAEQSGVSLPHLARMESSQGNVSVVVLGKVARALNQSVASMFAEPDQLSGDLGLIVEFLRQQPAGQLARIREQLFTEFQRAESARGKRIALIGLRGAGKSTVGKALAERLGRPFIELNEQIEREAGISVQEIITLYGQAGYRKLERRCLEELAIANPEVVLATGGGIVVAVDVGLDSAGGPICFWGCPYRLSVPSATSSSAIWLFTALRFMVVCGSCRRRCAGSSSSPGRRSGRWRRSTSRPSR